MGIDPFLSLLNLVVSILRIFYYIFYPLIWVFLKIWPVLYPLLQFMNPRLWWCAVFHGVSWQIKRRDMPFGIGGGYDVKGLWCDRCKKLYCERDP